MPTSSNLVNGQDFFLPLLNRKWLLLLEPDAISGYRIRPNIQLAAEELGFSFNSNSLGLRGPDNVNADNVLLGTSFAMGFAVNEGQDWWASVLNGNWLNISLAVGVNRLRSLYDAFYVGAKRCAVVIYHPNFWPYARQYEDQETSNKSPHDFFGWQTDERFCAAMQVKILGTREIKAQSEAAVTFKRDGVEHYIESVIYQFDFVEQAELVKRSFAHWNHILSGFDRVHIIRTRMKQELCPSEYKNSTLEATCHGFDEGWRVFCEGVKEHPDLSIHECSSIKYDHFYPSEGHWTAEGNATFAKWFSTLNIN